MNDEATTTLSATLDQQTMGRKWLIETFATLNKPMVGWQIDPFGHSTMSFCTRISAQCLRATADQHGLDCVCWRVHVGAGSGAHGSASLARSLDLMSNI